MGRNTDLKGYFKVGMYYHPPDQTLGTDLVMEKENKEVTKADNAMILGDFNYPPIDWVNEVML